jgi:hypothetical protein
MSSLGLSFFLYTTGIFAVGIYSARFSRETSSDFFLADRGLGPWVAALSSSASAESGWVTLGLVGTAFNTGVGALWIVPGTVAAFVFNWLVLGPRLRRAALQHRGLTIKVRLGDTDRKPLAAEAANLLEVAAGGAAVSDVGSPVNATGYRLDLCLRRVFQGIKIARRPAGPAGRIDHGLRKALGASAAVSEAGKARCRQAAISAAFPDRLQIGLRVPIEAVDGDNWLETEGPHAPHMMIQVL